MEEEEGKRRGGRKECETRSAIWLPGVAVTVGGVGAETFLPGHFHVIQLQCLSELGREAKPGRARFTYRQFLWNEGTEDRG